MTCTWTPREGSRTRLRLASGRTGWQAAGVDPEGNPAPPPAPGNAAIGGARDGTGPLHRGRAFVVVAVAVLLGLLMLQVGSRPAVRAGTAARSVARTPGSSAPATAASPTTTVARAGVAVLVENGTRVSRAANAYSSYLQRQGWKVLPVADTTAPTTTTTVYYASGQQAAASQLAKALGLPASSVTALTTSAPLGTTTGADVVLALGPAQAQHPPATSG